MNTIIRINMKKIFYYLLLFPILIFGQSPDKNWIKTTRYKVPVLNGIATPALSQAKIDLSYIDGLGRPIQQISHKQSASGNDIITHIEYDAFFRQSKEYLSYVNQAPSLNFITSAKNDTHNYYNVLSSVTGNPYFETTAYPYSEKVYEESSLDKVMVQSASGNTWAVGTGHEIRNSYFFNKSTDAVIFFKAVTTWDNAKGLYDINLVQSGTYSPGQLYKKVIKNENWISGTNNTTEEYKDKEDRIILKRSYNNGAHDTYYVYDIYGNLTYVIPPLATAPLTQLNDLCYQYKHDKNNRLVEKKMPGKQWEFIIYDKLDRIVATGPVFSPFTNNNTEGWIINKYDAYNKNIYTGWYTGHPANTTGRKAVQDIHNAATVLNENKTGTGVINNVSIAYTNTVFPTGSYHILSINYYDNYTYPNAPVVPQQIEGQSVQQNVKGHITGTWNRILTSTNETNNQLTYDFYDKKERSIRNRINNHFGGYTQIDKKVDFTGKTEYSKTTHKRSNTNTEILITHTYTYTNQDRLLLHKQQINGGPEELITKNTYDELGLLISKNIGGPDATGAIGYQKVDYRYNVRGWLTDINNISPVGDPVLRMEETDLFGYKINYNQVTETDEDGTVYYGTASVYGQVKPLYNGNISETFWKTTSDNILRKYGYRYDNLNRLLGAYYQKPLSNEPISNSYDESVSYDKNGNITKLKRTGNLDHPNITIDIDDLAYTYNGNRLMRVNDTTNNPEGFKDNGYNNTYNDYAYDANGNMIQDENKKITNIVYNHLNLPMEITFSGGNKINYLYSAAGVKVQKKVTDGSDVSKTDYLDGFQYISSKLAFFPHAEGYVKVTDDIHFNYVFNYTDHLGNIRVSWAYDKVIDRVKIMEESHYYPFGLKHKAYNTQEYLFSMPMDGSPGYNAPVLEQLNSMPNPYQYKFNGKELQDELGLNVYDYGARNYDPTIGRWMNIDPLAEQSRRWSPYNYAYNNPVYFIDPDGMMATDPVKKIISSSSQGNIRPVSVGYENKCLLCGSQKVLSPSSNNSGNGRAVEFSKKQDEHSTFYNILTEGGTAEFTYSVSMKVTNVTSQYYDSGGNKVDNISDASSMKVTTQTTTTTVNVNLDKVADNATVSSTSSSTTYDVSRKPNSDLQRGYVLSNGKTTAGKSTMSTMSTDKVDAKLQNRANQEARANFKAAAMDILDNLKKIPESQDRDFNEKLKKL